METVVATLVGLYHVAHRQLREDVKDLESAALHWRPGPETSSIAVLVQHMLGSEGGTLRLLRGLPSSRDRAAEFIPGNESAGALLERIDAAEALLEELAPDISAGNLAAIHTHPRRGDHGGLELLLDNYGHLREHLAQLELTKQLYQQRQAGVQ